MFHTLFLTESQNIAPIWDILNSLYNGTWLVHVSTLSYYVHSDEKYQKAIKHITEFLQ